LGDFDSVLEVYDREEAFVLRIYTKNYDFTHSQYEVSVNESWKEIKSDENEMEKWR
jgi:hypothetical protein